MAPLIRSSSRVLPDYLSWITTVETPDMTHFIADGALRRSMLQLEQDGLTLVLVDYGTMYQVLTREGLLVAQGLDQDKVVSEAYEFIRARELVTRHQPKIETSKLFGMKFTQVIIDELGERR